jgi:hypothetical protein
MTSRVLILACALPLSACAAKMQNYTYAVAPTGPRYNGPVAIYLVGATPKTEFTEVAVVQAAISRDGSVEDVLPALQAQAAGLGCDAVLYVRVDKGDGRIAATGMAARSASLARP